MGKKIWSAAAGFLAMVFIAAVFREAVWFGFHMPEAIGETVESSAYDLEQISSRWFSQYFARLKGWTVPYDYRIIDARIERTEILDDLEEPYIQLDYTVYTASANSAVVRNLELAGTEARREYTGQMVLCWEEKEEGVYELTDKLRPVEYQIQTPKFQEEIRAPQTEHYERDPDEMMTYDIRDGVLYVTYDAGESFVEVPGGYGRVCVRGGQYTEILNPGSYVVTEEFTGFIGGHTLLYSTDMGQTWQESRVCEGDYMANSFLSVTGEGYYVTLATDRSLGSDYYGTYRSEDLENWTSVEMPDYLWPNLTCVFWTEEGAGYFGKGAELYVTRNKGESYGEVAYPEPVEITEKLGFNPFDTVESMYEEDGSLYLVVGQGDDGDYAKDGNVVRALYQMQDDGTFHFIGEAV